MPSIRTSIFSILALCAAASIAQNTPGCGKKVDFAGKTKQFHITSSDTNRTFYLHLPKDYDGSDRAWPVLFGFHGATANGLLFETDTRLSNGTYGNGTINVYPSGINGYWAGGFGDTPLDEDLQFVADTLDWVREQYCVDNAKIYATGMSNGGGFVNRIACSPTVGSNFAAFAPVAGAYTGFERGGNGTCEPYKTPIPILSIHGANDTTVPYDGRTRPPPTPPIQEWLDEWAERNRCEDPIEETMAGNVTKFTWRCDGIDGAMVHYREEDMGHYWPAEDPNFSQASAGLPPNDIEGDAVILDFFKQWDITTEGESSPSSTDDSPSSTETNSDSSSTNDPSAASVVGIDMGIMFFSVGAALVGGFGWFVALV